MYTLGIKCKAASDAAKDHLGKVHMACEQITRYSCENAGALLNLQKTGRRDLDKEQGYTWETRWQRSNRDRQSQGGHARHCLLGKLRHPWHLCP